MRRNRVVNVHARNLRIPTEKRVVDIPRFRSHNECQSLAQKCDGKCLDVRSIDSMSKYDREHDTFKRNWSCHFGHTFIDQYETVEKRGFFCPVCREEQNLISIGQFKKYPLVVEKDVILIINLSFESKFTKISDDICGGYHKVTFTDGKEKYYFCDIGYLNSGGQTQFDRTIFSNCPREVAPYVVNPNDTKRADTICDIMCKTHGYINTKEAIGKLFSQVFYPDINKKMVGDITTYVSPRVRIGYVVRPMDTDHVEQTRDANGTIKILVIALTNTIEKIIQLIIKYLRENEMSKILDFPPDFITKCIDFITGKRS